MDTGFITDTFQIKEVIDAKPGFYPKVELYRKRLTRLERYAYQKKLQEVSTPLDKFRDEADDNPTSEQAAVAMGVTAAQTRCRAELFAEVIGKWDLRGPDGEAAPLDAETFLKLEDKLFDVILARVMDYPDPDEVEACGDDKEAVEKLFKQKAERAEQPLKN